MRIVNPCGPAHAAHMAARWWRSGRGAQRPGAMRVPTDAFGGKDPETMAATALVRLATFVAVRIVLAQEEGWDNEGGVSSHLHKALSAYIADHPIESPTEWLSQLIRDQDPELRKVALRVLEVRKAYLANEGEFSWDKMRGRSIELLHDGNSHVMQVFMESSMAADGE